MYSHRPSRRRGAGSSTCSERCPNFVTAWLRRRGRRYIFGWSLRIDPQIELAYGSRKFLAETYRSQLDKLVTEGDALGIHPHAWRWDPVRQVTVGDHGDAKFVEESAFMAVSLFTEVFGRLPDYHRYGSQYMSTATMNLLNRMGVPIDLTLEPGEPPNRDADLPGSLLTGETGDFRGAPRFAYQPSSEDYLRPAGPAERGGGLWELPLTSSRRAFAWPGAGPPLAGQASGSHDQAALHHVKPARPEGRTGPDHRVLAMWLDWAVAGDFWDAAFKAAALLENPYMAFAIRSDTGSVPELHDRFGRIMDALLADERCADIRFVTPAEALATMMPASMVPASMVPASMVPASTKALA